MNLLKRGANPPHPSPQPTIPPKTLLSHLHIEHKSACISSHQKRYDLKWIINVLMSNRQFRQTILIMHGKRKSKITLISLRHREDNRQTRKNSERKLPVLTTFGQVSFSSRFGKKKFENMDHFRKKRIGRCCLHLGETAIKIDATPSSPFFRP